MCSCKANAEQFKFSVLAEPQKAVTIAIHVVARVREQTYLLQSSLIFFLSLAG